MNDIERKYIKAEIKGHYLFRNALEVKEVLGYDLRLIKGFKTLLPVDQILAEKLICGFINNKGLEARENIKLIKIKREVEKFTLWYVGGYSYLYDWGSIG